MKKNVTFCLVIGLAFSLLGILQGCGFSSETMEFTSAEGVQEELTQNESYTAQEQVSKEAVLASTETAVVYVHVCGAVKNQGVYRLSSESRVMDAVMMAGGFTKKADRTALNLATVLVDGQKIYIPTKEEQSTGEVAQTGEEVLQETQDSRIDINLADEQELMTLPGIGESKAKAIIEYRTKQGGFKSVEELKNISGIKDGVLQKIIDYIVVG